MGSFLFLAELGTAQSLAPAEGGGLPLGNLVVTVPGDFPTVQQAITAVEGSPDTEVRLATNGTLEESITITRSVTLRAAPGFSPTLRGAGATSTSTIWFRPNVAAGAAPAELRLSGIRLLPRATLTQGNVYCVVEIENRGAGSADVRLSELEIDDPLDAGPDGLCARSVLTGATIDLRIEGSILDLAGGAAEPTHGFRFASRGTLFLSGVSVRIREGWAAGFDVRGPLGQELDFWLEGSAIELEAAAGFGEARVGSILGEVDASLRLSEFHLGAAGPQSFVSGIQATTMSPEGSPQTMRLELDRCSVSADATASASSFLSVAPFAGGAFEVAVGGNLVRGVANAVAFNPQAGIPAASIDASIVHNTIRDTTGSAIRLSGQPGSSQSVRVANNLLVGSGGYGLEITTQGLLTLDEHHNGYFENASGPVSPPFQPGPDAFLGDPLFAGASSRLLPESPLVDAGDDTAASELARDYADDFRRSGRKVDVGAYEQPSTCVASVTASHPGRHGTTAAMAYDLWRSTEFDPWHSGEVWLEVDLGCRGAFSGFRRFLTAGGLAARGSRGAALERVSTSVDGVTWSPLTASETTGWEGYVVSAADAWSEVSYGWSSWLRPLAPVDARHVRFHFESDGDRLHEVELLFGDLLPLFSDGFESGDHAAWS